MVHSIIALHTAVFLNRSQNKNMIKSLPDTYLAIFAFLKDGKILKKLFGAHEKSTGRQFDKIKTRPFFNDAQFEWETMGTSEIFFHFHNHEVSVVYMVILSCI